MKLKKILIALLCVFFISLTTTLVVSFSNGTEGNVYIKNITPIYDEDSGVIVNNDKVVFNDKDQKVKYVVAIENTQNYDVIIEDLTLSTPTEEFLNYELLNVEKNEVIEANSTKEIVVSFEIVQMEGWGRNFNDELTANIKFVKTGQETKPTPEEDEDINKDDIGNEDVDTDDEINSDEEIEDNIDSDLNKEEVPNNSNEEDKKEDSNTVQNEGSNTKEEEKVEQKDELNDNKEDEMVTIPNDELINKIEDNTVNNKEETKEEVTKKEEIKEQYDKKTNNKNNGKNVLLVVSIVITSASGILIIILIVKEKNKKTATIMLLTLGLAATLVNADEVMELPITFNISFKSQNVMKPSGWIWNDIGDNPESIGTDYWAFPTQILNIYIENENRKITEFEHEFDVSDAQNGRVKAYLVKSDIEAMCSDLEENEGPCYDLYLQADGIIYANENASFYFLIMSLQNIYNLAGLDTSEVTNMRGMFYTAGYFSENFTLDVSDFDTSNVTDMSSMFENAGGNNSTFTLELGDKFDTSKVTNMSSMFHSTGYNSTTFTLDVSNFDTSEVTNMSSMFEDTGYNSPTFTLDVSNFDTSNVTDMSRMFDSAGHESTTFTLDTSNFDTSKVTNMDYMFQGMGNKSTILDLKITIRNPNLEGKTYLFSGAATKGNSKITVNYIKETENIVDQIVKNTSYDQTVLKGNLIVDVDKLSIGDEIHVRGEKFNIISQTDDNITMLAKNNLSEEYKQTEIIKNIIFARNPGWEYTPGPKEIDLLSIENYTIEYIDNYVEYLKEITNDTNLSGDLITLQQLKKLNCSIQDDYSSTGLETCENSQNINWLASSYDWYTKSADPSNHKNYWVVNSTGKLIVHSTQDMYMASVRPVITISKESLRNLM